MFPTLCEVAGAKIPQDLELDGRSLLALIDKPESSWPKRLMFFHRGRWGDASKTGTFGKDCKQGTSAEEGKYRNAAVRDEQWRMVSFGEGKHSLYNIVSDPQETNDVSSAHPEIVQEMLKSYDLWWPEVMPLMCNENLPKSIIKLKNFTLKYKAQVEAGGIPAWLAPKL